MSVYVIASDGRPLMPCSEAKDQIGFAIDVLVPDKFSGLKVVRKARRRDRSRPTSEMLLMMWRSTRREIAKQRRKENAQAEQNDENSGANQLLLLNSL